MSADVSIGSSRPFMQDRLQGRTIYGDRLQGLTVARTAPDWLETGDTVGQVILECSYV